MIRFQLTIVLITLSFWAPAQSNNPNYELTFTGYTDFYYSSFNQVTEDEYQPLTTVGAQPGVFKNNISSLGVNLESKYLRGQLTTHSGNIVNATWDSQLQHIQEAYLGVHFFKDLYLDAGYFITHIGMESFMPKENLLSSTSIITYNEPFYQRGLRLQYSGLEHFDFQLWLLDGYNLFRDNNDSKSVGMAVSYEKGKFNASYSNIIGQELIPFDDNVLRTYHNFYITYEFYKNIFEINTSIDIGTEAPSAFFERKLMFANINTLRINLTKRLSTTFRYETQNDQNGMLTGEFLLDESIAGINIYGLTAGIGYEIQDQFYLRYEFRNLQERGNSIKVFNSEGSRNEHLVTIGWMFEHKVRIKK